MQAIRTRYLGPTNHRGARIVATCDAKRKTYSWDYALNVAENHAQAAHALATELGWLSAHTLASGGLADGSYAHVLVVDALAPLREIVFPDGDTDYECGADELGELCNLLYPASK